MEQCLEDIQQLVSPGSLLHVTNHALHTVGDHCKEAFSFRHPGTAKILHGPGKKKKCKVVAAGARRTQKLQCKYQVDTSSSKVESLLAGNSGTKHCSNLHRPAAVEISSQASGHSSEVEGLAGR